MTITNQLQPSTLTELQDLIRGSLANLRNTHSYRDYITFGLMAEMGEVYDLASKNMRVGYSIHHLDWMNELGDVVYWAVAAETMYPGPQDGLADLVDHVVRTSIQLVRGGTLVLVTDSELLDGCALAVISKLRKRKETTGSFTKRHDQPDNQ